MCLAPGIDFAASHRKADIILLRNQQGSVIAPCLQFRHDAACDDAIELVLEKPPVRAPFASGIDAVVAIVDEDFHCAAFKVQLIGFRR